MIFNSLTFLLFLLVVVVIYWLLPQKGRRWLIFTASIIFYGFWRVEFILIMMITPLLDYYLAHRIVATPDRKRKRQLLVLSIVLNLALLVYFKYLMFFTESINSLSGLLGLNFEIPHLDIVLPIGISFYTFHTMSFIIDTYRGFIKPPKDFLTYACYVFFFPQLVAGPILRVQEVIYQFENKQSFKLEECVSGVKRILIGLFLKVGIADQIAGFVDSGFAQEPSYLSALDVWTLSFMFGFQIYFDFSAYSSIAIGVALLMGIRFPENFNFPYMAVSPREFWKRWHISLSSWIRDYLYLPLAGRKVLNRYSSTSKGGLPSFPENAKISDLALPLFLTWTIMGLWHGANWTFIFWGLYHALLVLSQRVLYPITSKLSSQVLKISGWVITLPLIMLGWILFRAEDMNTVAHMLRKVADPSEYLYLGLRENIYILAVVLMLSIISAYLVERFIWRHIQKHPLVNFLLETIGYTVIIIVVFVFLRPISQFIYFQF